MTGFERGIQPERVTRDAERRQLTVMFCDLVGSTSLSGRLDPEDLRTVLDAFLEACETTVRRFGGMVGNYLGDGLLAYFGYPVADEDDAERAVHAGRAVIEAVGALAVQPGLTLQARIGIATGLVVARDIGADPKHAVVGETLNLAARLQEVAPVNGIAVADSTARLLGRRFRLEPGGPATLKGFGEPVRFWTVVGAEDAATRLAAKRPSLLKLVGREAELDLLRAHAEAAWRGEGAATLLRGEPGIGKSRLAAALAALLQVDAETGTNGLIVYQCSPFHRESVFYPFRTQFLQNNQLSSDDPPEAQLAALEQLLTLAPPADPDALVLLAAALSIPASDRLPTLLASPAEQRRRSLNVVLDILAGLAARQTLLVLFEDVHWADSSSLELLQAMVARLRGAPAFIVITARPEFNPDWLQGGEIATIELGHLDPESIAELVRVASSGRHLPDSIQRGIAAKADGVPLFAEELTLALLDAGESAPAQEPEIPATLKDSLMARLDRLGAAKDMAQAAAAIGREFSRDLLACIAERDELSLDDALARLEAADLISRSETAARGVFRFKHALVRDAAYESVLKSRRLIIHLTLATALQDRFPAEAAAEPEVVARHFLLARQNASATAWWYKAGELAMRRAGYIEAIEHFSRAIELADQAPGGGSDKLLRLRLQVSYGQALMAVRGFSGAGTAAAFQRAFEIATGLEDPAMRHAAIHGVWIGAWMHANLPAMDGLAAILAADAAHFPDSPGAMFAANDLGMVSFVRGKFGEAQKYFRFVLDRPQPPLDFDVAARYGIDPWINAYVFLGLTLWPLGEVEEAMRMLDKGVERAERAGFTAGRFYAVLVRCMVQAGLGETGKVREQAGEIVRLATAQGMEQYRAWGSVLYYWACVMEGDPGLDGMLAARRFGEETGTQALRPFLGAMLHATALAHAGEVETALRVIDDDLAVLEATGQVWSESDLHYRRGLILLRRAPPDRTGAEAAFRRAVDIARAQSARTFETQALEALAMLEEARQGGLCPP